MTVDEYEKEVTDLVEMLNNFRRIKDKGLNRFLKFEIKEQLHKILKN